MNFTAQQAADELKVSKTWVCKMIATGRIKATRHGQAWHITAAALQRYSEGRRLPGRPRKGVKG